MEAQRMQRKYYTTYGKKRSFTLLDMVYTNVTLLGRMGIEGLINVNIVVQAPPGTVLSIWQEVWWLWQGKPLNSGVWCK